MKPVVTLASELLQCLAHHQFERLTPHYGPLVRQVLTNDLLAKSWNGIIAKTGKIQYISIPICSLLCFVYISFDYK